MADEKTTFHGVEVSAEAIEFFTDMAEYMDFEDFTHTYKMDIYSCSTDDFPQSVDLTNAGEIADALETKIKSVDFSVEWIEIFSKLNDEKRGRPQGTTMGKLEQGKIILLSSIPSMTEIILSPDFQQIANFFPDFSDWINPRCQYYQLTDILTLAKIKPLRKSLPDIADEIDALKQRPEYANLTLAELVQNTDEEGNRCHSLFEQILHRTAERQMLALQETQETGKEHAAQAENAISEFVGIVTSLNPKYHTSPNNALMNIMQNEGAINTEPFDLLVSNATKRRKEITNYTVIELDGVADRNLSLTEFERQVSDVLISLWLEAKARDLPPKFTIDMIARGLPGGGSRANEQLRAKIISTVEKFRKLHIYCNATDEMRKRKIIGTGGEYIIDDYYLSARRFRGRIKTGGQLVDVYLINSEPLIYSYCLLTKQYLTIPSKYYAIQEVEDGKPNGTMIKMSTSRIEMTGYIVRRIAIMKRDNNAATDQKRAYDKRREKNKDLPERPLSDFQAQSNTILFSTIFEEIGLSEQSRAEAKRNRDFCFSVLDYQKAQKYIKDYSMKREGKAITGIVIEF